MSNQNACEVLFPVKSGIFGVGRLATRLTALTASHQIGEWHIGRWLDWKHTAIRIIFETPADAAFAKSVSSETETMLPQDAESDRAAVRKQALAMSAPLRPRPAAVTWPSRQEFPSSPDKSGEIS